jgi:phosphoserine phosphatase RsbU/P
VKCPNCNKGIAVGSKFCSICGAGVSSFHSGVPKSAGEREPRPASSGLDRKIELAVDRTRSFWQRMTEGLQLQELWARFKTEARESYGLYSKEINWTPVGGESKWKRRTRIGRTLFWAMMEKLSPSRRVFLLIALVFVALGLINMQVDVGQHNFQISGGVLPLLLAAASLLVLLALELADRVTMKRDLEIAREIQRWLVPKAAPELPGLDVAFATRPANTVAGDYYDAFLRPGSDRASAAGAGPGAPAERLLLVVADVAGKSVPAALLMATFQASLRTLAGAPSCLVDLVKGMNRYACAHSLGGARFTTAFLAELDPNTRALTYVNAGHNPPVLCRSSGRLERLEAGGVPLGIQSDADYDKGAALLSSGDLLAIFTDGLVEAENPSGEEYGEPRMVETVRALSKRSAAEDLERLLSSVDAFVGAARQHDDITCLILRIV